MPLTDPSRLVVQASVLAYDGPHRPAFVVVEDGRIAGIEEGRHPGPDVDVPGGAIVPGFIDLQINGAAGCDFLAPTEDGLAAAHAYLLRTGTTAYLPTLISSPEPRLRAALAFFAAHMRSAGLPRILGVHLEGPFLSPVRAGAHRAQDLRPPSVDWIAQVLGEFPGLIRIVTLAPELDGALDVVEYLAAHGVVVAVGHSDATIDAAGAAFAKGARLATHLFNAMRPYHHREPGIVGAALAHPDVTCSIIADGVHLHPAVVDQVVRLKGVGRVALVTDAIGAAGVRDLRSGSLTLGERVVQVKDGAPRLDDGTLAGSVLAMNAAVRRVAGTWGLASAVQMASVTPATLLGLEPRVVRPGAAAELVVLDRDAVPHAVVAGGVLTRLG